MQTLLVLLGMVILMVVSCFLIVPIIIAGLMQSKAASRVQVAARLDATSRRRQVVRAQTLER